MAKPNPIQDAMIAYLDANPEATNEDVAVHVRKTVPGATTTPSSVSSMKSRLKALSALGELAPVTAVPQAAAFSALPETNDDETLEDARARINVRYKSLERMAKKIVLGGMPSLVISGPPGLGKSHTMETAIEESELVEFPVGASITELEESPDFVAGTRYFDTISGSITAVGLYIALWNLRNGGLLFLDDIDEVFRDEVCLNLLKAALDSGKTRRLSWRKEAHWLEEYGIPKTFEFKGHVVFATNIDFEVEIAKGSKMAEHFKALIDRSFYLCLTLRTKRDFLIRIRDVSSGEEGMLAKAYDLDEEKGEELLDFVADNKDKFYNLSLRLVGQIATCMVADPEGWMEDVMATKMRSY